jgi:hypothetical protein
MLEFTFTFTNFEEVEDMLLLMELREKKLNDSIEQIKQMDFYNPTALINMCKEELEPLQRNSETLRIYLHGGC